MIRAPRCPYCHEGVRRGEALAVCRECHAFHHELCLAEAGGCAACSRALLADRVRPSRWKRLAPAFAVAGGFAFGQLLGMSVTLATRTSESAELRSVQACPLCCPRHHHHCH